MKSKLLKSALGGAFALFALAAGLQAQVIVQNSGPLVIVDQYLTAGPGGDYPFQGNLFDDGGSYSFETGNYIAGSLAAPDDYFRLNAFAFQKPVFSYGTKLLSASLTLWNPDQSLGNSTELTYQLFFTGNGLFSGNVWYAGSALINSSTAGRYVTIDFGITPDFLAAYNGVSSGDNLVFFGALLDGQGNTAGAGQYAFNTPNLTYHDQSNQQQDGNPNAPQLRLTFVPVPEPSTYGLIGAGALLGLAAWRRRKV